MRDGDSRFYECTHEVTKCFVTPPNTVLKMKKKKRNRKSESNQMTEI